MWLFARQVVALLQARLTARLLACRMFIYGGTLAFAGSAPKSRAVKGLALPELLLAVQTLMITRLNRAIHFFIGLSAYWTPLNARSLLLAHNVASIFHLARQGPCVARALVGCSDFDDHAPQQSYPFFYSLNKV